MSNKLRSIHEANVRLDKKFILREQQSGTTTTSGTTEPPQSGTTTQTTTVAPTTTQTTTVKPLGNSEINQLPDCWKFNSTKLGLTKGEEKDNLIVFNSKEGKPFCKKYK